MGISLITNIGASLHRWLLKSSNKAKISEYRKQFQIHKTVRFNYPENIWLKGNIIIGEETYINSGRFVSGINSSIEIGKWCALGHNINMIAWTHDIDQPTGPIELRPTVEKNIKIGDFVWIGTNVFIREGVTIGDHAIIAANSVVTESIPAYAIAGGVPAKIIRHKNR